MTLKAQWQVYAEKLEAVTLRERVLVLLCGLAVIYLIAELLWLGPQRASLMQKAQELEQKAAQMNTNQQALEQLQSSLSVDLDAPKKREIMHLQQQLNTIDQRLGALSVGLVRADQLATTLENMVFETGQLKLIKLETLPVTRLELQVSEKTKTSDSTLEEENVTGVYKHTTAVVVEGSYFQILNYLVALENLEWRFYWESIKYSVTQYPNARVEIQVYTLTTEEGLLGV